MSFQAGIQEGSTLLEVCLADQGTRLCTAMWYCLSIPVCSCGLPTEIYETDFPAMKKINSYSTEVREMYFQPENITFIEETWHCI